MQRPDDVEFLTGADDDSSFDEDVVEFGRGRAPRWLLILFGLVVVALVATATVAGSRHHPTGRPAVLGTDAPSPTPVPREIVTPYIGAALPIGPTAAVDVAVMGSRLYILQVGRLAEIDLATSRMIAQATIGDFADGPTLRLVTDPVRDRVWVVTVGMTPALITEFSGRTLARLLATTWPSAVRGAAVLDGYLYLQSEGVAVLAPNDRTPHTVTALANETGSIAADPLRHRLLIMHVGTSSRVLVYARGGPVRSTSGLLDVRSGDLAVVDGHVWLGGSGPAGAELEQLDPVTFAPGPNNPLFDFLGPGARIVARGQHVIWVRATGGQMASALSCIDAASGAELRSWFGLGGQVGSASGAGFIADGAAVLPLQLGRCRG